MSFTKLYLKISPATPSPAPVQSTTQSVTPVVGSAAHAGVSTGASGLVIELQETPEVGTTNRERATVGSNNQVPTIIGLGPPLAAQSFQFSSFHLTYGQRIYASGGVPQNYFAGIYVWMYRPGVGNVGELWSDGAGGVAWDPTLYEGTANNFQYRQFTAGSPSAAVDCLAGDRIAVEIWFKKDGSAVGTDHIIFGGNDESQTVNVSLLWTLPAFNPDFYPSSFINFSTILGSAYAEGEELPDFEHQVAKDGRGVAYKLDISFDSFATTGYRYSTEAGIDSGYEYDPRIKSMGQITRGFAPDRILQATSFDMFLSNEDGALDWMVNRDNLLNILKMRAKLWVGLYDPTTAATNLVIGWKQIGEFVVAENPSRDDSSIHVNWSDDAQGLLANSVVTPTIKTWIDAGGSPFNHIKLPARQALFASDMYTRTLPLFWGDEWHEVFWPSVFMSRTTSSFAVAGCATANTAVVATDDVTDIVVKLKPVFGSSPLPQEPLHLPRVYLDPSDSTNSLTLWEPRKSSSFSFNGKTWKILWIEVYATAFSSWLFDLAGIFKGASVEDEGSIEANIAFIDRMWVKGYPLSAMAVKTTAMQTPFDILADLITYYSHGSSENLDATSIARMKANYGADANACLQIMNVHEGPDIRNQLVSEILGELADSFDFDIFLTWSGKVAVSARNIDYDSQTSSIRVIDDGRLFGMQEGVPSREQRSAPFNRVFLRNFRIGAEPDWGWRPSPGPFDDSSSPIPVTDKVLAKDLSAKWRPSSQWNTNPWAFRNLDSTIRTRVVFATDLQVMLLELGDYFQLTWTRNLGGPFISTYFQAEALTLDPATNQVNVEGIWTDDLRTHLPFLLDDETLLTRVSAAGGRTATTVSANTTVTFSSGNLTSDHVAAGDHLLLKNSSGADADSAGYTTLKIASITDATHLVVAVAPTFSLAFDSWEIRRSHLTYPSDVTNYPDGSNLYGRVADLVVDGVYSDSSAGNTLLDG